MKDIDNIKQRIAADDRLLCMHYAVIAGSHAYGTAVEGSDVDIRGWYFPPLNDLLGLANKRENFIEYSDEDVVFYTFHKFIHLLAQCNPNVVEQVGVPARCKIYVTPIGQKILNNVELFLSKRAFQTFGGYANKMLQRFEQGIGHRNHKSTEAKQWKHLSHLIRLLYTGIDILKYHRVITYRIKEHDLLMSIRHGEVSVEKIMDMRSKLEIQLQDAYDNTTLPAQVDLDKVNRLIVEIVVDYINSVKG